MVPPMPTEGATFSAQGPERRSEGGLLWWLRILMGGSAVQERVETTLYFPMSAEEAWERIVFYEETLGRPPWILRLAIPEPRGQEGNKSHVGAQVRCLYEGGEIVKQVTALERPRNLSFDVLQQGLGIESCVLAQGGSYRIEERGDGCLVALTTRYTAYLHPRRLWGRVELRLIEKLHGHILQNMREGKRRPHGGEAGRQGELRTGSEV